jgi:chromosome segregation ATPase
VQEARDDQQEAKAQFATALDEFLALPEVEAGELEATYRELQRQLERSEARASDVRGRIDAVERVATALFKEWDRELEDYENESLREASARQLRETRGLYDRLITKMRAAEQSMDPVLGAFRDQVLFLKHNLNARAIASLSESFGDLESQIGALIREMEASIEEANAFIDQMSEGAAT